MGSPPPQSTATQIAAAPVPTPAPPVTSSAPEVIAVEQDTARQAAMKKSVQQTIWAGNTGGFNPAKPNPANAAPPVTGYKT